ncbi:MAG: hypothetical protein KAH22_09815 [Thiotrichaceae bacterium]|nr:hypothetical protein [Thiotrichaceae bacterium]
MNKSTLTASIALALTFAATTASADFPRVTIDSDVVLEYGQTLDMTGAINIPTVEINQNADISVNQFNHDSPVSAMGGVINNQPSGLDGQVMNDVQVNVTAVGNNASIEVAVDDQTIGAVQGNQNGGATAMGMINGNRIDLGKVTNDEGVEVDGIVELNVTAVGNNLSISAVDDAKLGGTTVGTMQFNYDSPVTATGTISGNGFGVNVPGSGNPVAVVVPGAQDPKLSVTAVGNNLSSIAGTTGSMTQINRNSPISSRGIVSNNVGFIGPVSVNVTAVGNNISIKAPGE